MWSEIMKVEGSGGVRGGASVRRAGKTDKSSGTGFAKQLSTDEEGPASVGGVSASMPLAGVGSVLALQEVDEADDATARASRGKKRAQDMLDKLDEIRLGLLSGEMSAQPLMELARTVKQQRIHVDDPQLGQILDEIDLRAQVELAKLTP
jgi:hypothetical protein